MQSCGMSFVKYLLFAFNIIFCITGILLIAFGGIVLHASMSAIEITDNDVRYVPSIILIVAGIVIFVIAFLGCFGAIRESYGMLMTFAVFLLIIFIVELAIGIAVAVNKDQLNQESFREHFNRNLNSETDRAKLDSIQTLLQCCGVDGYSDWGGNHPKSCCTNVQQGTGGQDARCTSLDSSMTYVYSTGCFEATKMNFEKGKKILMGIGIGLAFVEIVGIVLACWLAAVIKREKDDPKD